MMSLNPVVSLNNNHFHRNDSVPQQQGHKKLKNHNILGNNRTQLHKKRKNYDHHQPFPQQQYDGRPIIPQQPTPQMFVQQHGNNLNGFNSEQPNYSTPQINLPNGFGYVSNDPHHTGSLGSVTSPNFSSSNVQLSLSENSMFSNFPSTLVQHSISPLGVDIGSLPNLTQLAPSFINESISQQSFNNRQVMLEQLKALEIQQQQQLLKLYPNVKKTDSQEAIVSPLSGSSPLSPLSQSGERKHSHHDILRQHNEEYKMKQMKKAAVHQASSRYAHYAPQESSHFNFIAPSLPTYLIEGAEIIQEKEESS